ncbi:MAG: hypothetical protein JWN23_635 [Rhodocyclales bacterium]|nr:hypothetical protein [Rhodocyclales bacterium]
MSDTPQNSRYAALLNDLCEMQDSIIYAARKNVLIRAEHAIADMEKRLNKAEALVAEQIALAVAPILDGFKGVRFSDPGGPRITICYAGNLQAGRAMDMLIGMYERAPQPKGKDD